MMKCSLLFFVYVLAFTSARHVRNQKLVTLNSSADQNNKLGLYFGITSTIEKHPYMAGVIILEKFWCAGTIVSNQWIVTLADCVNGKSADDMTVVVGSNDGQNNGMVYEIKKIVTHPKYDQSTLDFNYVCIHIKGNFTFGSKIKSIKLATEIPATNTKMMVSGFGMTEETGVLGDGDNTQIHQGTMKWQAQSYCKNIYESSDMTVTKRMACAFDKGKVTICYGDFGDPVVRNSAFYGFFISGLDSGFCTYDAGPVLIATIPPVADWIKTTTGASLDTE